MSRPANPIQCPGASGEQARRLDPGGDRIHTGLAMMLAFAIPLGMAPGIKDAVLIALVIYTLLRISKIHTCFDTLLRDRLLWLILAWPAWMVLSLTWSPSPQFGIEEARVFRMLILLPLLWPVTHRLRWIVTAYVASCALVALVQLGQFIGIPGFDLGIQGRADAWMQPILAGALLSAAATWLLASVLCWSGRRVVGIAAVLLLCVVGLVLSGSRGPWVSLAIGGVLLVVGTLTLRPSSRRRVAMLAGLSLAALAAVIMLDVFVLSGRFTAPVWDRVESALVETDASAGDAHYEVDLGGWHRTPVGYRLLAWDAARSVFERHPIVGVGAGGLSWELDASWWLGEKAAVGVPFHEQHFNPHSMYLQVLASTGIIGLVLLVLPWIISITRFIRHREDPVFFGAAFVLAGWCAGAVFDGYQMNSTLYAITMLTGLAALTLGPSRKETRT